MKLSWPSRNAKNLADDVKPYGSRFFVPIFKFEKDDLRDKQLEREPWPADHFNRYLGAHLCEILKRGWV